MGWLMGDTQLYSSHGVCMQTNLQLVRFGDTHTRIYIYIDSIHVFFNQPQPTYGPGVLGNSHCVVHGVSWSTRFRFATWRSTSKSWGHQGGSIQGMLMFFLVFNEFMDEWHRINTVNIDVEKKQWGSPLAKLSTTGFCFHIELLVLEEAKSYVVITVMGWIWLIQGCWVISWSTCQTWVSILFTRRWSEETCGNSTNWKGKVLNSQLILSQFPLARQGPWTTNDKTKSSVI